MKKINRINKIGGNMKKITLIITIIASIMCLQMNSFAQNKKGAVCVDFTEDQNQSGLHFRDLFKVHEFLKPLEHPGIPNTVIFSTYYGGWPAASIIDPDCTSIEYFLDTRDNRIYAMYVTIACDGGNSFGIIISQSNLSKGKNIVVGKISDSELHCPNEVSAREVDNLYN